MLTKGKRLSKRSILLWMLILLPYLVGIIIYVYSMQLIDQIRSSNFILIDKDNYMLQVYSYDGRMIEKYGIALGKSEGKKRIIGDMRTPEGVFNITSIENSSAWTHDFKDDTLGTINGAYGPYFIRLNVPGHRGIGIHGTHDPKSIGKRVSEGCIRMRNEDITKLLKKIHKSSIVVIIPGRNDVNQNTIDENKDRNERRDDIRLNKLKVDK
jgi:lipoprotein-anchoring transpeptidase ErfK/SrfK